MVTNHEDPPSAVVDFIGRFLTDCASGAPLAIEDYLERYPEHREEIERTYEELKAEASAPQASEIQFATTPKTIGPYRVQGRLGSGGQGIVYLAEDTRLGRQVALKVLHPATVGSDSARERFRREAEVISRLEDPGLCSVYEANLESDLPYIAMRYLAGETLSQQVTAARDESTRAENESSTCLPRGRRAVEATIARFERLARSLHVAHEAGVVHRDIKPGNLIVGEDGQLTLLDFGLARSESSSDRTLTLSGDTFGTPAYMSPEQLTEDAVVDRRTDVYSLGVTLYECLTLTRPFQGTGLEGQRKAVLTDRVPDPKQLNPDLPRELTTVLEMAMERDLSRRYATASEFADELRRILNRVPIHARRPSLAYSLAKFVQRNRRATAVLAILVILLAAALWSLRIANTAQHELGRQSAAANLVLAMEAATSGDAFEATQRLESASLFAGSWETRMVERLTDSSLQSFPGGPPSVRRLAVSKDATRIAAGSMNRELHSLDLKTGRWQKHGLPDATALGATLSLSDDGALLAASTRVDGLAVLNLETGKPVFARQYTWLPRSCVFSPDKKLIACASEYDDQVRILSPSTGAVLESFQAFGTGSELFFAENSQAIVGVSAEGLWRWEGDEDLTVLWRFSSRNGQRFLALDGSCVASFEDNTYQLIGPEGVLRSSGTFNGPPRSLDPSGNLIVGMSDRSLEIRDVRGHAAQATLAGHETRVTAMAFASDGMLFSADRNGTVKQWDLEAGSPIAKFGTSDTRGAAISDEHIITTAKNHYIVWDTHTFSEQRAGLALPGHSIYDVAIGSDGSRVAFSGLHARSKVSDKPHRFRVSLIGTEDGTIDWTRWYAIAPRTLSVANDTDAVAIGLDDGSVEIVDLEGQLVLSFAREKLPVRSVRWSADRTRIAWITSKNEAESKLHCWDLKLNKHMWSKNAHNNSATALEFSPDGSQVASGGLDEMVRIWNARDGEALTSIPALGASVNSITFHPTEPRLAAMVGTQLQVWDIEDPSQPPVQVVNHHPQVGAGKSIKFSQNGETLTIVGQTGIASLESRRPALAIARQREAARRERAQVLQLSEGFTVLHEISHLLDEPALARAAFHEDADELNKQAWIIAMRDVRSREDQERAAEWAKRAVQVAPSRARYWNTLGMIRLNLGQLDSAVECFLAAESTNESDDEEAVRTAFGPSPYNLYPLAQAYALKQDFEEAQKTFATAERLRAEFASASEIEELRERALASLAKAPSAR